ncbi:PTS sugar transporter subunit IIA [Pseudochelatococcus sp. B33]
MKLADIIKPENVVIDLPAATKEKLLRDLAGLAAKRLEMEEAPVLAALQKREILGSTGIGNGVAIPHAGIEAIADPFALFVRLRKPIAFDSVDDLPVDIVFLILVPAQKASSHLNLLSCIARKATSQAWLAGIRSAASRDAVLALLDREER